MCPLPNKGGVVRRENSHHQVLIEVLGSIFTQEDATKVCLTHRHQFTTVCVQKILNKTRKKMTEKKVTFDYGMALSE